MFSLKLVPSSSVTPGILCDLRILELLRKVRSTGGSQPLSGSSSIDFPLSIMCTAFRERRMSLSCTLLPRWSTWYCNPSSCARQAVSFWMEASAYFWSAACKALGSGVGIVSWGSVGGVLHAARSRCSKASEIWCLAVFLARRALRRVVAGVCSSMLASVLEALARGQAWRSEETRPRLTIWAVTCNENSFADLQAHGSGRARSRAARLAPQPFGDDCLLSCRTRSSHDG